MSKPPAIAFWIATTVIVGAILFGLVPLFYFVFSVGDWQGLHADQGILKVLAFTLKQAFLSTLISVLLGLLTARALVRRTFFGRGFLLNVFAVPMALPAIVAVLGTLAVYGNVGWFAGWLSVYGLTGILLVHIFFNLPLATRFCVEVLNGIDPVAFRLGDQLSFSDWAFFKHIEWPVLRSSLPRVSSLVFLLCAASFVVVLTLGGPQATTLEVAVYQSLRFDFDVGRAIALSVVQIVLSVILVAVAGHMILTPARGASVNVAPVRNDGRGQLSTLVDWFFIIVAALIVLPPLAALHAAGMLNITVNALVLRATGFSFCIGILAALLAVTLAWPLARRNSRRSQILALAGLIVPPAVLATGWFLAFKNVDGALPLTLGLVVSLNALMALPFSVAILSDGFARLGWQHERLCAQLGLTGWDLFWQINLPFMRNAALQALLLAFVLSLGDLTAITLLGSQGLITLPSLIHQQMGNYRSHDASGTALLLSWMCFAVATLAQKIGALR
jgi:thiamine transport system permease protein